MYVGLQIPSFNYPGGTTAIRPRLKDLATTAEGAGFYSFWVMDHFYQIRNLFGEPHTAPMMEAYTALGYIAGVTEKMRLGALVTGVIYRQPSILLKTVSTLDILSGGRAYFGIGAAWYEGEARGYGIPYPDTSTRFEWLEETLQMAHTLWGSDGESTYTGKHFTAPKLVNNPPPISKPHPRIMIGGTGPKKTLRMVAQYADACNLFQDGPDGMNNVRSALATLREHCETLGRPYEAIEKTTLGTIHLADGHDSVSRTLDKLHALHEMGVTHVIVNMPNAYEMTPIETFGKDIIPKAAKF